jgi:hypothetical protein
LDAFDALRACLLLFILLFGWMIADGFGCSATFVRTALVIVIFIFGFGMVMITGRMASRKGESEEQCDTPQTSESLRQRAQSRRVGFSAKAKQHRQLLSWWSCAVVSISR